MTITKLIEMLSGFPVWLDEIDALIEQMPFPPWTAVAILTLSLIGVVFALRELASWFLKTNSILDEVARLKQQVHAFQAELKSLENTIQTLEESKHFVDMPSYRPSQVTSQNLAKPTQIHSPSV